MATQREGRRAGVQCGTQSSEAAGLLPGLNVTGQRGAFLQIIDPWGEKSIKVH